MCAAAKPNLARTFLVMAAELGTFKHAKRVLAPRFGDGLRAYLAASTVAALAAACTSTPADVVKTRLMAQAGGAQAHHTHSLTVFPLDLEGGVAGDEAALVIHGLQGRKENETKE